MSSPSGNLPDYYEILGVPRTASLAEITAAYLLLAKQWHPDMNCQERETATRFKLANEAHEVLSDSEKRREYDRRTGSRGGRIVVQTGPMAPHRPSPKPLRRPAPATAAPHPGQWTPLEVILPVTPEEARAGAWCSCSIRVDSPCPVCERATVAVDECPHCGGAGVLPQRQPLQFRLPAGVADGMVLEGPRIRCSETGATPVQVLLRVKVVPYW